jgi:hypothetical protein
MITLLLDSGAFSAWRRDISISIDEYVEFIKRNKELIFAYVNMDVIPGSKGKLIRTHESVERSARLSYENLQRIKDKGLNPIPVFHQGENFDWLERLIDDKESYIGISPYLRSHPNELHRWLDRCFGILAKRQGKKPIKTHGFGATGPNLLLRYPWTTVDSTSWALKGGFGQVYIPALGNKEPDFSRPTSVRFSPRITTASGISYGMLGLDAGLRHSLNKYVRDQLDLPIESVCNTPHTRQDLNIIYYQGLQKHVRETRKTDDFNVVFATMIKTNPQNISLTRRGANFRLLSYFELRETKQERFEKYMTSGLVQCKMRRSVYDWNNESYVIRRYHDFVEHMKEIELCAEQT